MTGPGTFLARQFKWILLEPDPECDCTKLRDDMDSWGPDGCEQRMDEILDRIEKNAKVMGIPYSRWTAERFVRIAIWRARRSQR